MNGNWHSRGSGAIATRSARVPVALLATCLVAAQLWYSRAAVSRVTYEELAEGVRNPVWVTHGLVYDGVSSNVAWYGALAAWYTAFGFSFSGARFVRLVLHAGSILCMAALLVRWLGRRRALVPLAAAGTSPSLLYFNTMSTSYGIDLQWAPILGWLLWRCGDERASIDAAFHAALGLSIMLACLMWPGCMFYVPFWFVLYVMRARQTGRSVRPRSALGFAGAAALPFITALALLENRGTWLFDPLTGSGVFRGGGAALNLSPGTLASNAARIALDLLDTGSSYYFWLSQPDLSGVFGLIAATTIVLMLPGLWFAREYRLVVVSAAAASLGGVVLSSSATGPPGLRRATIVVAAFYLLYVCCWKSATAGGWYAASWKTRLQLGALSMLLVHHACVFVPNLGSLRLAPAAERHWFAVRPSPEASVNYWVVAVNRGEALDCRTVNLASGACRYAEVYAAIEATRRSIDDGQSTVPIRAVDPDSGILLLLEPGTWPFGSGR